MSPSVDVENTFFAALQRKAGPDRAAFLDQTCRDEPDTRREIERLIAVHAHLGDFLEHPPAEVAAAQERAAALGGDLDFSFLEPPTRPGSLGCLAHYEILEVLGSGGFGVVLKALDSKLQRTVAIKTLCRSLAASPAARQRFVREARAAAAVSHDNTVHTYAVEESGPVPYLVMEYVAGLSLHDKLKQGPFELAEVLRIGEQVADGLAAAHAQGLVHRDIKPGNILIELGTGRVKITDFGLARAVDDTSLSREGLIAGTPEYMSPEQARGAPVDHRADLFSLGSVLYAMCTGRSPFAADGSLAVLKRLCQDKPVAVNELRPELPLALSRLIARLHAIDPAKRPQSASEVRAALEACRHLAERPAPAAGRIRRRTMALALGAVIVGSLLAWAGLGGRRIDKTEAAPTEASRSTKAPPLSAPVIRLPRVLIIIPSRDFVYSEAHTVRTQLTNHGIECVMASTTLDECQPLPQSPAAPPQPVKPDLLLSEAKAADYAALYFCGGPGVEEYAAGGEFSAQAVRLTHEALTANRTVAATGVGVVALAEAGVLEGREVACYPYGQPPGVYVRRIQARGAVCSEQPIAEDGPFVTCRGPQDMWPFMQVFLNRLGAKPRPPP